MESDVLGPWAHRDGKTVISLVEVMAHCGDKQGKQCDECCMEMNPELGDSEPEQGETSH